MEQNHSAELSGYSFQNIYNKNDHPDPLDPKSHFFLDFPGFSTEYRFFVRTWVNDYIQWGIQSTPGHKMHPRTNLILRRMFNQL